VDRHKPFKVNEAGLASGSGPAVNEADLPIVVPVPPPVYVSPYTKNEAGIPVLRVPFLNSAGWPPTT
jgi:hypothetical protein